MQILYHPIGVIHSPFHDLEGMPIQPVGDRRTGGSVEVFPQFSEGLQDLAGFSHLYLLFHLHMARFSSLTVTPFLDSEPRGLFATRAPNRPNPIGLSLVKLLAVEDNILTVESLDVLDGTPLLDIKPYVPLFEETAEATIGWLEKAKGEIRSHTSDGRFLE
ncbi:MAG: tRNA (N6-threonylcarbamoyladenosine(37)-N6)-methyltransferase TrmO [Candidatus Promineifilaceae bacterium]